MATGTSSDTTDWNNTIYDCIQQDLNELNNQKLRIIITGDFNCHCMELDGRETADKLRTLAENNRLRILNLEPTCEGKTTWTRGTQKPPIDYFLVNKTFSKTNDNLKLVIDEEGRLNCDSDHNLLKLSVTVTHPASRRQTRSRQRHRDKKKRERWKTQDVNKLQDFAETLENNLSNTPSVDYDQLIRQIENVAMKSVGKTSKKRSTRRRNQPWFDDELRAAVDHRKQLNRAKRKAIKLKEDYSEQDRLYQEQKAIVSLMVTDKIRAFHEKITSDIKEKGKRGGAALWRYIRNLEQHENSSPVYAFYNENQQLLSSATDIERFLTTYFTNQQGELQRRSVIPKPTESAPISNRADTMEYFTVAEVERGIRGLSSGKAAGPDNLPNEFIKAMKPQALQALTHCFNEILYTKVIPDDWKRADIQLLHKGKGKPKEEIS
ncbi:uncharacterized protein LOC135373049 [Ornithodoros turicata]|uniref:uncharacterized protein LOC135373049 n=1 Tax=Ornithodoros turicata TaxID=34597 RepID=UPI003138A36B